MELIKKFEEAARKLNVKCLQIPSDRLESDLAEYLKGIGVRSVVVDSDRLSLSLFEHVDASEADCGVSEVRWGIASTATLVIPMIDGNRRTTSLLPPVSIGLLRKEDIVPDLTTSLNYLYRKMMKTTARPSSVVFVTGPSRTADIELNLIVGVHGPRELHVVLC